MAQHIYEVITDADVKRALDYIAANGKPSGDYGILHIDGKIARARKVCVKHNGKRLSMREVLRVSFLFHFDEELEDRPDLVRKVAEVREREGLEGKPPFRNFLRRRGGLKDEAFVKFNAKGEEIPLLGRKSHKRDSGGEALDSESLADEAHDLLVQFNQIIFDGPPGTGKTRRAMELLSVLLDEDEEEIKSLQGKRWDIVQFHPAYNYEDFVRGVKVETESGSVVYKTENRVFGNICERAEKDSENYYILIIDEINRANVSAVLGELIYALEYRGQKIKTPYRVGGSEMLAVPNNLYIIGTMNTADRTIGQIDYAVRRRFAFVHCPPDESVIPAGDAKNLFREVNEIFERYVSPDYNADDVRIGHSYFLADSAEKLAKKVSYQIIPILREYVKDGVLSQEAEILIDKFGQEAEELVNGGDIGDNDEQSNEQQKSVRKTGYFWKKDGKMSDIMSIRQIVASIVKDYFDSNPSMTFKQLIDWFPDKGKDTRNRGIKFESEMINDEHRGRFSVNMPLVRDGKTAYVTNQWGATGKYSRRGMLGSFISFSEEVAKAGYKIYRANPSKDELVE